MWVWGGAIFFFKKVIHATHRYTSPVAGGCMCMCVCRKILIVMIYTSQGNICVCVPLLHVHTSDLPENSQSDRVK